MKKDEREGATFWQRFATYFTVIACAAIFVAAGYFSRRTYVATTYYLKFCQYRNACESVCGKGRVDSFETMGRWEKCACKKGKPDG